MLARASFFRIIPEGKGLAGRRRRAGLQALSLRSGISEKKVIFVEEDDSPI
jgi:hypothetical protein